MGYTQFSEEWKKEMMKMPKAFIINQIDGEIKGKATKKQLVEIFRTERIVADFNKHYKTGDVIYWRSSIDSEYEKLHTSTAAQLQDNIPVVFCEEKDAYCSIEPSLIK